MLWSSCGGMAHGAVALDDVAVAASDPFASDEPCRDKVGNDALRCPLGDADHLGDVSLASVVVSGDAERTPGCGS